MDELYFVPLESSETSKIIIDSLYCSSPRKSLVKGERFIRGEEKPELINSLTRKVFQCGKWPDCWGLYDCFPTASSIVKS